MLNIKRRKNSSINETCQRSVYK